MQKDFFPNYTWVTDCGHYTAMKQVLQLIDGVLISERGIYAASTSLAKRTLKRAKARAPAAA